MFLCCLHPHRWIALRFETEEKYEDLEAVAATMEGAAATLGNHHAVAVMEAIPAGVANDNQEQPANGSFGAETPIPEPDLCSKYLLITVMI